MVELHREGSGEPLVLIHGVCHHWQGWRPVIDRLAGEFDVIAVDTPGFGRSTPLPATSGYRIEAYVDAFEDLFADLALERPHVVGNSMGGGIALELARRRIARTATAIAPVGFWTARERAWCSAFLKANVQLPGPLRPGVRALARSAAGRKALFPVIFSRPENVPADEAVSMLDDVWGAPAAMQTLDAFEQYTFRHGDELRGVPVTVAWGSKDRLLIHGRQAPRARRALPWARHITLEGLGHTPMFDDPDAVAGVIRAATKAPAVSRVA